MVSCIAKAAALLLVMAAPAQAEVLFRGTFLITAVNEACAGHRGVGDQSNAQFHPRGLGNDDFTALTTIWEFGGQSYLIDKASFGTSYKKVQTGGLGWSTYNSTLQASILLNAVPTITATTNVLTLVGKIKNPNGQTDRVDCEFSFRAVMYKDVE